MTLCSHNLFTTYLQCIFGQTLRVFYNDKQNKNKSNAVRKLGKPGLVINPNSKGCELITSASLCFSLDVKVCP